MGGTKSVSASWKSLRRGAMLVAALGALWGAPAVTQATDYTWNINSSGFYDLAANWSPVGVPNLAGDTASFNQPGTYTVTFGQNRSINLSDVYNGSVTWALSGLTYTLSAPTGMTIGLIDAQTARLTLSNGTVTNNSNVEIANSAADTGFLTVSSNATYNALGLIRVGDFGTGTLSVINGGSMTTGAGGAAIIGATSTSLGAATVSGSGSRWVLSGALTVGLAGSGSLSITGGGVVNSNSASSTSIANSTTSSGSLLVSGAGSLFTSSNILLGDGATGTATVSAGGAVNAGTLTNIGNQITGIGTLTVTGAASTWTGSSLNVGASGTGTLNVLAGGNVSMGSSSVGLAGNSHGTVTVDGPGSGLNLTGVIAVGNGGSGSVTVSNGGALTTLNGLILGSNSGSGGTLTVTGGGSTISSLGGITIGSSGAGALNIADGAVVSLANVSIASNFSASSSGTAFVTGAGATWNTAIMNIGASNSGTAVLVVEKGGTVNASGLLTLNDPAGAATATLAINTGGTLNLSNGFTRIGTLSFTGGNFNVNGGIFNNGPAPAQLTITGSTAADFPVLRLSGNSVNTSNISSLALGVNTPGAIEVLNGAHLSISGAPSLGFSAGTGNLLIDGAGSNMTAGGNIQLGVNGSGTGTMTISNGGSASTTGAVLGLVAGTTGTANLSGAGSTWVNGGNLIIGQGGGATVNVNDAAILNALQVNLGFTSAATMNVRTGASLSATTLVVGIGGDGTLNVQSGGTLATSPTAFIANGAANGTATITGAGSAWNASAIQIGSASSGSGTLNVLAGSSVTTGTLTLNDPAGAATGTLLIDGSNVTVNGGFTKRGTLDFRDGTLTINGGNFDNAAAASPLVIDSAAPGKLAALRLTAGSQFVRVSDLTIGQTNAGSLSIGTGSNVVSTGNVVIADKTSSTGTMTVDGIFNNTGALRVGGGVFAGGPGTLLIEHFGEVVIGTTLFTYPQGTVRLDNGRLVMGNYSPTGSSLDFISGSVTFSSDFELQDFHLDGIVGPARTLRGGQSLFGNNDLTLSSNLKVDGGTFEAFNDLIISPNTFLTVSGGTARAANSFTTQPGGVVSIAGGGVVSDLDITNAGEIQLHGGTSLLLAANNLNNTGLINGNGQVSAALVNQSTGVVRVSGTDRLVVSGTTNNFGLISLLNGGTVQFNAAMTNAASGRITGRGVIDARAGVINNGQMAFSGDLSDIFGAITNNSGGKIIVTGGGMATFYDTITHNGGAEIRVSAGSSAVFLGPVNGVGIFSGSGTKYFEGGGSAVGPVITPGSTVVEAAASLSATLIREDSLAVNGTVKINTSGGTSHLNQLNISGSTDNWDGILDLKNNSLVLEAGNLAVITNQIKSGLYQGTGITSSAPGSPFRLGSMSNSNGAGGAIYSAFQGISGLNGDEVLIRYTRIGDLNLDGTVTISDFIDLASNFNHIGGSTWQMGDLNYDGSVTISDFIDLASNFNQSISGEALPISAEESAMLAQFAADHGGVAVPEPSTLLLCILIAAGARRRYSTAC